MGQNEREGSREETEAHLPVPVEWLGVVGRCRKQPLQRRQRAAVDRDEDGDD